MKWGGSKRLVPAASSPNHQPLTALALETAFFVSARSFNLIESTRHSSSSQPFSGYCHKPYLIVQPISDRSCSTLALISLPPATSEPTNSLLFSTKSSFYRLRLSVGFIHPVTTRHGHPGYRRQSLAAARARAQRRDSRSMHETVGRPRPHG